MRILDQIIVYERGLQDPDSLDEFEFLVYVVRELEICSDMEGWDHFFIYRRPQDCEALPEVLRKIGDATSAEVIDDYAAHVRALGLPFPPPDLPCLACSNDRDWGDDFSNATEQRWTKVAAFLRKHGIELTNY